MLNSNTRLILIYSPQGGTGKSTITANLAIISSLMGIRTLLIDFATFGSISTMMRLTCKNSNNLTDIIKAYHSSNNPEIFLKIFQRELQCANDNLHVIQNCNALKMLKLDTAVVHEILDAATRSNFELVFVDTSPELNKKNLYLTEITDFIFIPVIQDIACNWKVVQFKEIIDKSFMDLNKVKTIINMCNKNSGFINNKFEIETGFKNIFELPYYPKNFQSYLNQGYMLDSGYNKKALQDFTQLTSSILSTCDIDTANLNMDFLK